MWSARTRLLLVLLQAMGMSPGKLSDILSDSMKVTGAASGWG